MKPAVDILVQSARWRAQPRAKATVIKSIAAAATMLKEKNVELSVLLTGDKAIRVLNRDWRGFDKPTNVLSFPALPQPKVKGAKPFAGDIVIAYETLAREAKAENRRFLDHLAHLSVHGFLHLMGYDHEENRAAEAMEKLERRVLAKLDIADPYAAIHG
jgi:probable rRNA maturation factor